METRNKTTDSAWPITSNPSALFNNPASSNCNIRIPLWQIVRASTAAPAYFPPEVIRVDSAHPEQDFVFVDGGTTPYNNPAFLMYGMATHPAYHLGLDTGEDKLLVVSMGTGSAPVAGTESEDPEQNLASSAANTLSAVMNLGRQFLYVRYDVELSRKGLDNQGLPDVEPELVSKLDSTEGMGDLLRIGEKLAGRISKEHLGPFA